MRETAMQQAPARVLPTLALLTSAAAGWACWPSAADAPQSVTIVMTVACTLCPLAAAAPLSGWTGRGLSQVALGIAVLCMGIAVALDAPVAWMTVGWTAASLAHLSSGSSSPVAGLVGGGGALMAAFAARTFAAPAATLAIVGDFVLAFGVAAAVAFAAWRSPAAADAIPQRIAGDPGAARTEGASEPSLSPGAGPYPATPCSAASALGPAPDLLESDRLERLGRLAGGIAHDFNNLLTGILGNTNFALAELEPGAARSAVVEVEAASRQAKHLVAQLLGYAGKGQLTQSTVDLNAVVDDLDGLMRRVLSPHADVKIVKGTEAVFVEGDQAQLRQVIVNLLGNASDSLGETPGQIFLSLATVEMTLEDLQQTQLGEDLPAGPYILLQVRDTGCGMDAETLRRMFEPYFSTKVLGRGLGLAALQGIVRNHRGTIAAESSPGMGTTFRVWLPSTPTARGADGVVLTPRTAASRFEHSGTVLVAEDEEMVRRVVTRMLSKLGFDVITASDGEEAVRAFEESVSELVLLVLDVQMPRLDGGQVLARISERHPGARVVLMTGFSETVLGDLPRPPDALLRKPFSMHDLTAAVGKALSDGPLRDGCGGDDYTLPAPPQA